MWVLAHALRSLTGLLPAPGAWYDRVIVNAEARFIRTLKAGEVVFREGDAGATIFVVRKGRVRISKGVRGGQKTFAVLGPGELFLLMDRSGSFDGRYIGPSREAEVVGRALPLWTA